MKNRFYDFLQRYKILLIVQKKSAQVTQKIKNGLIFADTLFYT